MLRLYRRDSRQRLIKKIKTISAQLHCFAAKLQGYDEITIYHDLYTMYYRPTAHML